VKSSRRQDASEQFRRRGFAVHLPSCNFHDVSPSQSLMSSSSLVAGVIELRRAPRQHTAISCWTSENYSFSRETRSAVFMLKPALRAAFEAITWTQKRSTKHLPFGVNFGIFHPRIWKIECRWAAFFRISRLSGGCFVRRGHDGRAGQAFEQVRNGLDGVALMLGERGGDYCRPSRLSARRQGGTGLEPEGEFGEFGVVFSSRSRLIIFSFLFFSRV
jgi:hypothetical protein